MARLIDNLRASNYKSRMTPQTYVYNFTKGPKEAVVFGHDEMTDMEYTNFVGRLAKAPVLVIDAVTELVFGSPRENWELDKDLPCLIPKGQALFLETRAPGVDRYFGKEQSSPFPGAWGWLVNHIGHDTLNERAAALEVPVPPDATQAIHCTLAIQHPRPISMVVAPIYTYIWPLDRRGGMVGLPMRGYSFAADTTKLPPGEIADHYFSVLMIPALMALAFLNSDLVSFRTVVQEEKLQKIRKKKGRPQLANYNVLELEKLIDVLRFEGQSGLLGLRHALKECRRYFLHGAPQVIGLAR